MQKKFYHYAPYRQAHMIVGNERYGYDYGKGGLLPTRAFDAGLCRDLPDKASDAASYGLLDPLETGWASEIYDETYPRPIFELVLRDINRWGDDIVLLEIEVAPEDDIYVADHGFHLSDEYMGRGHPADSAWRDHPGNISTKFKYFNSLVPFDEYVAEDRGYVLPEVICFSPIPPERIKPIEKINFTDLVNRFREKGGFPLTAKPKPRGPIDIMEVLERKRG